MTDTEIETVTEEAEVIDLPPTVEVLQAKVAQLEADLVQAGQTMTQFKALVRTEAMAMAESHNLCSVVEQTLHKVGIDTVRRRVEVRWTHVATRTYDVPEELLTLVQPEQFIRWATTGAMPRGRTARDFRSVRTLTANDAPVGEAEMTISTPDHPASPIGVAPPAGYLAAYASDDSRVLHFIPINARSIEPDRYGRYRDFTNATALCGTFGEWRTNSGRAATPPRACSRCAR